MRLFGIRALEFEVCLEAQEKKQIVSTWIVSCSLVGSKYPANMMANFFLYFGGDCLYLKAFFIYTGKLSSWSIHDKCTFSAKPSSLSSVCLVRAANARLRGCVGFYILHGCIAVPITNKLFCIGFHGNLSYRSYICTYC